MNKANLRNISILLPNTLPVPAIRGGAIETLVAKFIEVNEKFKNFNIIVYINGTSSKKTIINNYTFKKTKFIFVPHNFLTLLIDFVFKLMRKVKLFNFYIDFYMVFLFLHNKIFSINSTFLLEGEIKQIQFLQLMKYQNFLLHLHTNYFLNLSTCLKKSLISLKSIVVVSHYLKRELIKLGFKGKIMVLKNTYDESHFPTPTLSQKNIIKPPQGIKKIVYCGRLTKQKGVFNLLEAYSDNTIPFTELLIIGSSSFNVNESDGVLKNLMSKYSNNKSIKFFGYMNNKNVSKILIDADLVVVPSIEIESAGLVIIENIALGNLVLTTNVGGISEYCGRSILIDVNIKTFNVDLIKAIKYCLNLDHKKIKEIKEFNFKFIRKFNNNSYYKNFSRIILEKVK